VAASLITRLASRDEDFEGRVSYARYDTMETSVAFNKALNTGDGPRHYARLDYSRTSTNGYIDRQRMGPATWPSRCLATSTTSSHTLAIEYLEERGRPLLGLTRIAATGRYLAHRQAQPFQQLQRRRRSLRQRTRWLRSITDYRFDDNTQLRNTFYHYNGQRDYRNLEVYRYNADNSAIARSGGYRQRHDQEVNGNKLELTHQGQLFGLASDWAFGMDYSTNQQTNYPLSKGAFDTVDPNSFEPGHFLDIPGMDAPMTKGRTTTTDTTSAFVENRTRLTDQLSLITALRYDHIDFDVVDHVARARLDRRWDAITGRLGLVYDLTSNVSLYTQYSTSAEPPGGTLTSASISQVGDFDLSTGRQVEVGSKFDFPRRPRLGDGSGVSHRAQDISVPSSTVPNTTEQAGQQTSTGIELAASFKVTSKLLAAGNWLGECRIR
jgi:iron complex outermembrane receptor protein